MNIKQYKQFPIVYLLAGFIIFAIAWFVWQTPDRSESNWVAHPPIEEAHSAMSETEFEPNAANVSASTHSQLDALQKRVVDAPDDTTHLYRLARLLQDGHKPEEAARNYKHYLALHPNNYQAWLDMTQSYGRAKLWDEALVAIQDMLKLYPDDPSALYNLGAVHANLGNVEEARLAWEKTIDQNKDAEVTFLAESSIQRLPLN